MSDVYDRTLAMILAAPARIRHARGPAHLRALFRDLARPTPSRDPDAIEDLIFALWIDHADATARADMGAAIEAIEERRPNDAIAALDGILQRHPDWAEAWNKRAIAHVIAGRDERAACDIAETIRCEPRHFAAISGFGQLCLRQGRHREAKAALMVALTLNPHLQGVRETIAAIETAAADLQ